MVNVNYGFARDFKKMVWNSYNKKYSAQLKPEMEFSSMKHWFRFLGIHPKKLTSSFAKFRHFGHCSITRHGFRGDYWKLYWFENACILNYRFYVINVAEWFWYYFDSVSQIQNFRTIRIEDIPWKPQRMCNWIPLLQLLLLLINHDNQGGGGRCCSWMKRRLLRLESIFPWLETGELWYL